MIRTFRAFSSPAELMPRYPVIRPIGLGSIADYLAMATSLGLEGFVAYCGEAVIA